MTATTLSTGNGMARRLRIKWAAGQAVDALLEPPMDPSGLGVLLAHGAGAGQRHPFMVAIRRGIAAGGHTAMSFDYSYTDAGRKAPDRLNKLLDVHAASAARLGTYVDRVVLAGKSMGGRVGSHLAGDRGYSSAGLIYYGYPLVPLGSNEPRPTDHLDRIPAPQLFFAGSRDRLGPVDLVEPLTKRLNRASLVVIDDGDHSFKVPKRTGLTQEAVMGLLIDQSNDWLAKL